MKMAFEIPSLVIQLVGLTIFLSFSACVNIARQKTLLHKKSRLYVHSRKMALNAFASLSPVVFS